MVEQDAPNIVEPAAEGAAPDAQGAGEPEPASDAEPDKAVQEDGGAEVAPALEPAVVAKRLRKIADKLHRRHAGTAALQCLTECLIEAEAHMAALLGERKAIEMRAMRGRQPKPVSEWSKEELFHYATEVLGSEGFKRPKTDINRGALVGKIIDFLAEKGLEAPPFPPLVVK